MTVINDSMDVIWLLDSVEIARSTYEPQDTNNWQTISPFDQEVIPIGPNQAARVLELQIQSNGVATASIRRIRQEFMRIR